MNQRTLWTRVWALVVGAGLVFVAGTSRADITYGIALAAADDRYGYWTREDRGDRGRAKEKEKFDDGKHEYKYDDGRVKVEEKIDRRADKYEYKYEGPDGKCEEKYDQGKYEHKCE